MFTIASEKIKYLGVSLAEEMKALYAERYKTLMKTIEVTNRKVFCAHGLEELTLSKCSHYIKQSRSSLIPIKIIKIFFIKMNKKF